jgi:hypothetical protein
MSAVNPSFAEVKQHCRDDLTNIVPEMKSLADTGPLDALATIIALSKCRFSVHVADNAVAAALGCDPALDGDVMAQELIERFADTMTRVLCEANHHANYDIGGWVDEQGFTALVADLVRRDVDPDAIERLTQTVSDAVGALFTSIALTGQRHVRSVRLRDLGEAAADRSSYGPARLWALAPDLAGDDRRPMILERRRQALEIYGAVVSALRDPAITAAIDRGDPLNTLLQAQLGLTAPQLRHIRGLRGLRTALDDFSDLVPALRALQVHEVPFAQWPGRDEAAWKIWDRAAAEALLRPNYAGARTEARDALAALVEDLLAPLAGSRLSRSIGNPGYDVSSFVNRLAVPGRLIGSGAHKQLLRALHAAIIGARGPHSFNEAVEVWHRRAATLAAVRHEGKAEQPGWPALCQPWQSSGGDYDIVPLTSAEDLVSEGNALEHCVGGYYAHCRSGNAQILSLRERGARAATIELLLADTADGGLVINLGQFKAYRNMKPAPDRHEVLRQFLSDLGSGRHPVASAKLAAYRKEMADHYDHVWRNTPMPLEHARKAWPLYRPLLPKGSPDDFDAWAQQTGLTSAIDTMIAAIAHK